MRPISCHERQYHVPDIDYVEALPYFNRIRYRIKTDRGTVVDFVVQYEMLMGESYQPVVRYDGSHGQGHRDILDIRGETIDKRWLPEHMDLGACLDYGRDDLRANWESYRDRFLERYT